MSKDVEALGRVLRSLSEWGSSDRQPPIAEQIECLRLTVVKMQTTLAFHEVQIAKLREAIILLSADED